MNKATTLEITLAAVLLKLLPEGTDPTEIVGLFSKSLEILKLAEKQLGPQAPPNGHELSRYLTVNAGQPDACYQQAHHLPA
jgi:hypothetical protein